MLHVNLHEVSNTAKVISVAHMAGFRRIPLKASKIPHQSLYAMGTVEETRSASHA